MADCPVHGVPHRSCEAAREAGQVEAVVEAIEAEATVADLRESESTERKRKGAAEDADADDS